MSDTPAFTPKIGEKYRDEYGETLTVLDVGAHVVLYTWHNIGDLTPAEAAQGNLTIALDRRTFSVPFDLGK